MTMNKMNKNDEREELSFHVISAVFNSTNRESYLKRFLLETNLEDVPVDEKHEDEWQVEGEQRRDDDKIRVVKRTSVVVVVWPLIHTQHDGGRHR